MRIAAVGSVLALAVLGAPGIADAGGGFQCALDRHSEGSGSSIVYAKGCVLPGIVRVEPGTKVDWTNADPMPHTVTSGVGGWGDGYLEQDDVFSITFERAGTYTYYCKLHADMGGIVFVGEQAPASAQPPPSAPASSPVPLAAGTGLVAIAAGFGLGVGSRAIMKRASEQ